MNVRVNYLRHNNNININTEKFAMKSYIHAMIEVDNLLYKQ